MNQQTPSGKQPQPWLRRWRHLVKSIFHLMELIVQTAARLSFLHARPRLRDVLGHLLERDEYASLSQAMELGHHSNRNNHVAPTNPCPLCGRNMKPATSPQGERVMLCSAYPMCSGNVKAKGKKIPTVAALIRRADRCPHWDKQAGEETIKQYGNPAGQFRRCQVCMRRWKFLPDAHKWHVEDDFDQTVNDMRKKAGLPKEDGASSAQPSGSSSASSASCAARGRSAHHGFAPASRNTSTTFSTTQAESWNQPTCEMMHEFPEMGPTTFGPHLPVFPDMGRQEAATCRS